MKKIHHATSWLYSATHHAIYRPKDMQSVDLVSLKMRRLRLDLLFAIYIGIILIFGAANMFTLSSF